jgi:hypothetical protein
MPKVIYVLIAVILLIHGIYSVFTAIKGGPLRSLMFYNDTFLASKILGEKGKNIFYNLFWGLIEIVASILIIYYNF